MVIKNVTQLEGHVLEPVVDLEGIDLSGVILSFNGP